MRHYPPLNLYGFGGEMKDSIVLIGDNSLELGIEWAHALKSAGYFAITRECNGKKLLNNIGVELPSFLVINAKMPELDAVELLEKMKKEYGRLPKTIVVGNCASAQLEKEVMDAGACYFMVQPFNPDQLVRKIETLYNFYDGRYAPATDANIEYVITEILQRLGIPPNLKGYHYLRRSIILCVTDPDMQDGVTKQLYPTVASEFKSTSSRVERAIRHAIEAAWENDNGGTMSGMFGNTVRYRNKKPTNSEFIAIITDKLRLKYFRKPM